MCHFRPSRWLCSIVPWLTFAASLIGGAVLATTALAAGADESALFDEAHTHFQKGRVDEALDAYEQLEKEGADPARIAIGRSLCFQARGEWSLATEMLVKGADKHPGHALLQARLAEAHWRQGAYELAAAAIDRALKLDPDQPLARLVQADLLAATGKLKEADEGYRWFVRYYNKAQPTDAETLLLVARGSAQYARWHGVTQIFDFVVNTLCPDALAKDPGCWPAHLLAASLLLEKYNRRDAMPELRKALTVNPRAADVHAALADAALQEHSLADAEQHAARALEINPRHTRALSIRADLRLEEGDVRSARELSEQALEVNPHDELVLARLAVCHLLDDGLPPTAEIDELFGNLDNIAEASVAPEKTSRFGKLLMEIAQRNPHPGLFLGAVGKALESRKKFDLAERFYRQAVASMPQLSAPRTDLGMLYMRIGRNEEAAKILDKAFEADPYHVRVSNMRKVLKVLEGYETIATEHFVIRVDGQADRLLGRYMALYLEEEYPALVAQFGYEPPARTQFEIFNKAKGLSAHQWFSARMVGLPWVQTIGASTGMIVALASPTATEKPYNWARVLKHEFVHILTLQKTHFNIPHWYTEALAVTSEGGPRPEQWNQLLLARVPAGNVMNLDNINLGFIRPKTPDDWTMAYCQSRLYAQYMTDKFAPDATARLLEAYRENLSTERAIRQVCGVDKETFEKGYRDYLEGIVAGPRGSQPEPPVTLAEAEKAHQADPESPHAAARYAFELVKINRRKDARRLAEAALAKNKGEPLAAVVMARLELRGEDLPAAVARLERALDRAHPHLLVLDQLAELKLKQEKFSEAAELYDLGLSRDPDHVPWLKGLATALLKENEPQRLRSALERLAAADSDNAAVPRKLAAMALEEKNYAEALRYGKLSLYVDVLDVDTHRLLAAAYAGLEKHDKAADEWGVALELKPDDPELTVEAARAERAAGKTDAARARLKALLEKKPAFAPAKALYEELQ